MPLTRSITRRLIRTIFVSIMVIVIVGYAAWRSLNYARGPEITIFEPLNGSTIATSTLLIRGQAERINNLMLNGSPLSIDEEGNFIQILAIFPGLNILTFKANDQFGRSTTQELRLFGSVDLPKSTKMNTAVPMIKVSTTTP